MSRHNARRTLVAVTVLGLSAPLAAVSDAAAVVRPSANHRLLSASEASVPLNDCVTPDNGDPQIRDMVFTPQTVDVRGGPQRVQVRVSAVDTGGPGAASGIAQVLVYVSYPRGSVAQARLRPSADGWWQGSFTVYPGQSPGRWTAHLVELHDNVRLFKQYFDADLTRRGIPHEFTVIGPSDEERPVLRSMSLSPTTVSLSRKGVGVVRVRARADDDVYVREVLVRAEPREARRRVIKARLHSLPNGDWSGELVFPTRWNVDGRYRVTAFLTDGLGRIRRYGPRASVSALLTVSGGRTDPGRPQIVATRVTPDTVDVRATDRAITVDARLRDPVSGIDRATVMFSSLGPLPIASTLTRVSGTRHDGRWRAILTVPRCLVQAGPLPLQLEVYDGGRRRAFAVTDPLRVQANDHVPPGFTGATFQQWPLAGPLVFEWEEDVVGISNASAPLRQDYERSNDTAPPTPLPGAWSCRTAEGSPVDCVTGPVRVATYTLDAPMIEGSSYTMEFNPPGVLDVTDLAGNPVSSYSWNYY